MRGGDNDPSSLSDECLGCCEAKAAAASSNEVHPVTQSEIHLGILAQQQWT
jgi:plastocyanin domain-containing protein